MQLVGSLPNKKEKKRKEELRPTFLFPSSRVCYMRDRGFRRRLQTAQSVVACGDRGRSIGPGPARRFRSSRVVYRSAETAGAAVKCARVGD